MRLAPAFAERGKQVIDLSGAFRLERRRLSALVRLRAHARRPGSSARTTGCPSSPARRRATRVVANPGCYATAALLALAPLVRERLIEPAGIIVDAKSGVTGAGKQSGEALLVRRGTPTTRTRTSCSRTSTRPRSRARSRASRPGSSSRSPPTPADQARAPGHVLRRGRCPGATRRARRRVPRGRLRGARGFVRAMAPDQVTPQARRRAPTRATSGPRPNDDVVIAVGAIDNLLKGAAGQARAEPESDERLGRDDGPRRVAALLAIAGIAA